MVSEAPSTRGPGGAELVARLAGPHGPIDLFVALDEAHVRCAGCARDLSAGERCFTLRHVGAAAVPACTSCEPLPPGAVVEWERVLYRECVRPGCAHPRLASRVRRSGDALQRAELAWEHERRLSTWGPGEAVHRPRPGRLLGG